ncbi:MAG: hypothetical protein JWL81_77 [Verrucomicrobiales bacterium]|nr:hypothetical protein [Verrucomicrobiales bacterium]
MHPRTLPAQPLLSALALVVAVVGLQLLLPAHAVSAQGEVARWADPGLPVKSSLELWLDATRENEAREAHYMNRLANGDAAEIWHDSSGRERHLVQWTRAARPDWQSGALEFDGNDYLAALLTPGLSLKDATIFVVTSVPTPAGDFPALLSSARRGEADYTSGICLDFGRKAAGNNVIDYLNIEGAGQLRETNTIVSPVPSTVGHLFAISLAPNLTTVRIDGQTQGQRKRTDVALSMDRLAVGARFVEPEMRHFLTGRIAEVLVFSRKLDESEQNLIESYLQKKHADFLLRSPTDQLPDPGKNGPVVQMLVPGFEVHELPVQITNLNNIEYAPDGRLFAGGYDGRFHLLRDRDGDGIEEDLTTFSKETTDDYPLGMVVKNGMPHAILSNAIVRFRDTDDDGIPDKKEIVAQGWDDPALQNSPLLMHRRVDSAMALAAGPDDDWYITMGSANPGNGYWQHAEGDAFDTKTSKTGTALYSPDKRRGCLLRIDRDGKVEQLNSGLRYIMSLQWDQSGELFGTDQEGATWLPNGNPYDELLHLQKGRHYGFPPWHPRLLPGVVDEPSVWDYAPQHQSACGFRFNGPSKDRAVFGPEFWAHDAIVTGESRGKLWRTKVVRTPAGYVAMNQLIACLGMLVTDCAISPKGELVICCHSGEPDWGSGPNGQGKIFKIRYTNPKAPVPVLTWPASETECVVAFDQPLAAADITLSPEKPTMVAGKFVEAGDHYEAMRPGYAVVKAQQQERRDPVGVQQSTPSPDRRNLIVKTAPRLTAVNYSISSQNPKAAFEVAHDLSGILCDWTPKTADAGKNPGTRLWLPHADFTASRGFTRGSAAHDLFWHQVTLPGTLQLQGQLDLSNILTPVTQPGSTLDYTPDTDEVTVVFQSNAPLALAAAGAKIGQTDPNGARLTLISSASSPWLSFTLTLTTPADSLDVSYHTSRDPRPRALPVRRFLVPFAKPAEPSQKVAAAPEIAGGDWKAGHALFHGKASCSACHRIQGEGNRVGPDLDNLIHRDHASVLTDISDPGATINPDAVAYTITLRDGTSVTGTRLRDTPEELDIAQPGGAVNHVRKDQILKSEPLTVSLMPPGLDKLLTPAERKDLMTYLLSRPLEKSPGK